jgi:hypothetical protein
LLGLQARALPVFCEKSDKAGLASLKQPRKMAVPVLKWSLDLLGPAESKKRCARRLRCVARIFAPNGRLCHFGRYVILLRWVKVNKNHGRDQPPSKARGIVFGSACEIHGRVLHALKLGLDGA